MHSSKTSQRGYMCINIDRDLCAHMNIKIHVYVGVCIYLYLVSWDVSGVRCTDCRRWERQRAQTLINGRDNCSLYSKSILLFTPRTVCSLRKGCWFPISMLIKMKCALSTLLIMTLCQVTVANTRAHSSRPQITLEFASACVILCIKGTYEYIIFCFSCLFSL